MLLHAFCMTISEVSCTIKLRAQKPKSEVAFLCRKLEVSSDASSHLKATASRSSDEILEGRINTGRSTLSSCRSVLQQPIAGNAACLQSPCKGTDEFWMHPAVGDCVIHLGAVPPSGQKLVTRWVDLFCLARQQLSFQ